MDEALPVSKPIQFLSNICIQRSVRLQYENQRAMTATHLCPICRVRDKEGTDLAGEIEHTSHAPLTRHLVSLGMQGKGWH